MTLAQYLKDTGESAAKFAHRAQISRATAFRVKKTGLAGSATIIEKIVSASDNRVSAADLLSPQKKTRRARARKAA